MTGFIMQLYRLPSKARFLETTKFSQLFQKYNFLTGYRSVILDEILFSQYLSIA